MVVVFSEETGGGGGGRRLNPGPPTIQPIAPPPPMNTVPPMLKPPAPPQAGQSSSPPGPGGSNRPSPASQLAQLRQSVASTNPVVLRGQYNQRIADDLTSGNVPSRETLQTIRIAPPVVSEAQRQRQRLMSGRP